MTPLMDRMLMVCGQCMQQMGGLLGNDENALCPNTKRAILDRMRCISFHGAAISYLRKIKVARKHLHTAGGLLQRLPGSIYPLLEDCSNCLV